MNELYHKIIESIEAPPKAMEESIQHKIDMKTKPLGALGTLEDLAVRTSLIQQTLDPVIKQKNIFVFAGDHGIAEEKISAFPAEVTPQMVLNFLGGGAAINVLCRHYKIDISVIDIGVNYDFEETPGLINKKVRKGTRNFAKEEAMTRQEAIEAIEKGMEVVLEQYNHHPMEIIGLGEMGIGNTTPATAIISCVTGKSVKEITGRGTGLDDTGLNHKIAVLEKALKLHKPNPEDALDILQKVGGYEIAGIAGAVLAAASKKVAVVLDGIISTAGGLIAGLLNPEVKGYLFSAHASVEHGQKAALAALELNPIVDLNMRLGEGTGSAIAINLIEGACTIMREMASFEEAGVSNRE